MSKTVLKNISFKVDEDLHLRYKLMMVTTKKKMKAELIKFIEREVTAFEKKLKK